MSYKGVKLFIVANTFINILMHNNFFQHLDIGFDVDTSILEIISKTIPDLDLGYYKIQPEKLYDPKLIEFLNSVNLKIIRFDAVRVPSKKMGGVGDGAPIHYDGHYGGIKESKIAWAFGEELGDVNWYEPKNTTTEANFGRVTTNGSVGSPFLYYKLEDCNLIKSTKILNPTLINVDILHSVDNPSDFPHWYLTYSLGHKDSNKAASWEETYEIFKPYFK